MHRPSYVLSNVKCHDDKSKRSHPVDHKINKGIIS